MKMFKFGTICLLTLCTAACSIDEDFFVPDEGGLTEYNLNSEIETGRRVFVIHPWEGSVSIPLSKTEILDFVFESENLNIEKKIGKDYDYLLFTLKEHVTSSKPFLTKIPFSVSDVKSSQGNDTLYIVCQPLAASVPDAEIPSYQTRIGTSVDVTKNFDAAGIQPMLDVDLMVMNDVLLKDVNPLAWGDGRAGMTYEETHTMMQQQMGIDVSIPGQGDTKFEKAFGLKSSNTFKASLNEVFSKNTCQTNKFEYQAAFYYKSIIDLSIQDEGDTDAYIQYITPLADSLLNYPGSDLYGRFPNSKEGIYNLYSTYGTHILVGGVFGGTFTYLFSQKADCYYEDISYSVSFDLSERMSKDGAANWMESYLNTVNANGGGLSIGGGEERSEYHEHIQTESLFYIRGGNVSADFNEWDASVASDKDNLSLVSFSKRGNKDHCYLIPLYLLSKDAARRDAMSKYLQEYVDDNTLVLDHPRLVVADFMMMTGKNGHSEEVDYKVFKDPQGHDKVYFPLVANDYVPGGPKHCMLDTSADDYLMTGDNKDQFWWVLLAFEDECKPITHICFITEGENDDLSASKRYTLRGEDAPTGMAWPEADNHKVGLRFADSDDSPEDYITGVALSRKADNGNYYVIASSPGTDMLSPYEDYDSQEQFRTYWGSSESYVANSIPYSIGLIDEKEDDWGESDSWFGSNPAQNSGNWIMPAYTTKDIDFPLVDNSYKKNFERPQEY